ncbi:MAG: hypothetical protein LC624_02475 [Halobacteriales archaeon]|nr:hypothetical protein [Halobacteriales archaeon]
MLNAGSGVLFAALGLYVGQRRPRRRGNLAFAGFAIAFGVGLVPDNLVDPSQGDALALASVVVEGLLYSAAAVMFLLVAVRFPRAVGPSERRLVWAAMVPGLAVGLIGLVAVVTDLPSVSRAFSVPTSLVSVFFVAPVAFTFLVAGQLSSVLLLGLRFARAQAGPDRRAFGLTAAALVLYPGALIGDGIIALPHTTYFILTTAGQTVLLAACVVAWLRSAARTQGPDARLARNLVLLMLAVPLLSMLIDVAVGPLALRVGPPQFGIARTLGVLVLAYAILRHQLLGIDVRVKWTLRQSTVAAAFIGVFFVVSNGAQTLFQSTLGPYLGIAAAGLLIFAIAPLQRAAERLADAAMPGVKPAGDMGPDERTRAYRDAARVPWADGAISKDERALLDQLRETFGLSYEEAALLEREGAKA